MKIVHYNIDRLDQEGGLINILMGERSNGKSYQVKHKKGILKYLQDTISYHTHWNNKNEVIKDCIKAGSRFMLIRRLVEECKPSRVEPYFTDIDVHSLTDGKYDMLVVWKERIYLANYNDGKTKKGDMIGYIVPLAIEQNFAGGSFLDVTDMIMEEFISRTSYLKNEPSKLMNLYSTVDRKRGTTRLWLCGNTISPVCPYFNEWELDEVIRDLKQGEIRSKWLSTDNTDDDGNLIEVKLCIEYCESAGGSSFVIGKHKNMANKGEWQSDPQPHLTYSRKHYKTLYKIGFYYKNFKFLADYILDPESSDVMWFVYPFKGDFKDDLIVFSDVIKPSIYWQRDIYLPSIKNDKIKKILQTFKENQIFYASDLCGTDFKQVIDFMIKK